MLVGYFPRVVSGLLILVGAVITLRDASHQFRTLGEKVEISWRPILFVPLALVAFGVTIETFGLLLAVFTTVVVLSFAERKREWRETLVVSVVMSISTYVIFVLLLDFPMPVFPGI
jgi:hypothetical protein